VNYFPYASSQGDTPIPPSAGFTTTTSSELTISFSDTSTGEVTSWNWNFGDGKTDAEQNPSHTYENEGTFTVSLTVTGPDGTDIETSIVYVVAGGVSELSVSPAGQNVSQNSGTASFDVSNTGTGTMSWTAAIAAGSDWLRITSGSGGSNTGTISCSFDANSNSSERTGTIRVTASGANGSPKDISVVQAAGAPSVFTLTVSSSNGSVAVSPNKASYNAGEVVTLTATPSKGYKFTGWSGDGCTGSQNSCTLTMDANKAVTAMFDLTTYTINAVGSPSNGGTITINPVKAEYSYEETVTLVAESGAGFVFDHWEGDISGSLPSLTFQVSRDLVLTAFFIPVSGDLPPVITPKISEGKSGAEIILEVVNGVEPFNWSVDSGKLNITTGTSVKYTAPQSPGEYTVNVTDSTGNTSSATIEVYNKLTVSPETHAMEVNKSFEFRISGGKEPYAIFVNMGSAGDIQNSKVMFNAPNEEGQIVLTVTDSMGQKTAAAVSVVRDLPLSVSPAEALTAPDGNIKFTASGGKPDYTWTTASGQLLTNTGEEVRLVAPGTTGDFLVTVTDSAGTQASANVRVIGVLKLTPSVAYTQPGKDIEFNVEGGVGGYQFTVETGEPPEVNQNRAIYTSPAVTGNYWIKVTDSNSNTAASLVVVGDAPKVSPSYIFTGRSEIVNFMVAGGIAPYTVTADVGEVEESGQGAYLYRTTEIAGIYYITVTDSAGISTQMAVETGDGNIMISPERLSINLDETGEFNITGGNPPYDVVAEVGSVSPAGQGTYLYRAPDQDALTGDYFIKVTDAGNNKASAVITLSPATDASCVQSDDNLKLKVPCLKIGNVSYTFDLAFHPMPEAPGRLFWMLDMSSFVTNGTVLPGCLELMEDLGIKVGCLDYAGTRYSFDFKYFANPADMNNVFFEMDLGTLH